MAKIRIKTLPRKFQLVIKRNHKMMRRNLVVLAEKNGTKTLICGIKSRSKRENKQISEKKSGPSKRENKQSSR